MTYQQLKVLQAIVLTGTFRGAAERVHKSQPAVSGLIKNLEEELGLQLFSRDTYRPELTADGRVFYEKAVDAITAMNRLNALASRLTGDEEAEVRVAVNQICPLSLLLLTLKRIDHDYPATRLTVTTESVGGAMDRIIEGSTDIAVTTEIGLQTDRMEAYPFHIVRVIPVARPDYGPAARGGHNSVDDVRGDVQVVVADSSTSGPKQSLDLIPGARQWTVTDVAAKKEIIMAGMGWGGLPEHIVARELSEGTLVRVQVESFEIRSAQLFLVRRTDRMTGVVADSLWNTLRQNESTRLDST